jgi:hypothetical protein
MIGKGREAVAKRKSVLNRLGESQKFLKTILGLGVAASEVSGVMMLRKAR